MSEIHPSSVIDANAEIGADVEIGPFCTVGAGVKIGKGCRLISHVVIEGPDTELGEDNTIYPFSVIGVAPQILNYGEEETKLVIGCRNIFRESVSIHRGSVAGKGETQIGDNNLLMGYVHIAHDCLVGNNNVLTNYVGLSGHVTIDDFVILGGRVGVVQFLRVGSYAFIGGASVIDKNIPPYTTGYGNRIEIKGVNIVGLKRQGFTKPVIRAVLGAHRLYYRSGLSEGEALKRIENDFGDVQEVALFTDFLKSVRR